MATTIEEEQTMKMKMRIPEVDDIVIEILLRLPANSLLRFQWACKYWFDLIRDPYFVKKHLFIHHPTTTTTSTTHDHHQIIIPNDPASVLLSSYPSFEVDSQKLSSLLTDTNQLSQCYIDYTTTGFSSYPVKISHPLDFSVPLRIFDSCHGLLFFRNSSKLCLWNPCTKEYKKLPPPPPPPPPPPGNEQYVDDRGHTYRIWQVHNYGFGYDHKTDDYKVIRNAYFYQGHMGYNCIGTHVQVYTLGTNSWRSSEHIIPYTLLPYSFSKGVLAKGVFVNGALYWVDSSKTKIISFDIEKESYQEISNQPKCFHGNLKGVKLEMFEGCLCLLSSIKDPITQNNFTEMWVMKDENWQVNNNNESSWTKLFRIPQSLGYFSILKPLMRFTTSGKILLLNQLGGNLFSCDPKNNTTKILNRKFCEGKGIHYNVEAVYIESLVSLNSGTYTYTCNNKGTRQYL